MNVLFTAVDSCLPEVGGDTASFLLDGKHLIDTGWCPPHTLRDFGVDPLAVETVLFSHLHHDHYLGLPHLLFYHMMRRPQRRPLRIAGPGEHLAEVVQRSLHLLQPDRFPELHLDYQVQPLQPGDTLQLGDLHVATCIGQHVGGAGTHEPSLHYRFTSPAGASLVYSGDTSYHPALADFARGAQVLIHDGAHSTGEEAARIAAAAGVGKLYLIHQTRQGGPKTLAEAKAVFAETYLAERGARIAIRGRSPNCLGSAATG